MKIILASRSPRRKQLLELLNLDFSIHPSTTDEDIEVSHPSELVRQLAQEKAMDVAESYQGDEHIVIGADTLVALEGEILAKPLDEEDAFNMLKRLSDNTHEVFTGVCILHKRLGICQEHCFVEKTKVTFSPLEDEEIRYYIATGSPMDKAGAYGIQDDWGALFVKKIEGDYYNVVGFPIHSFYQQMKEIAPEVFTTRV